MWSKRKGYILKNILTGNDSDSLESTQSAESSKCCQITKVYSHCVNENKIPQTLTFKVPDDVKSLQGPHSVSCGQKGVIKNKLTGNDSDSLESTQNAESSKCCQIAKVYSHCDVPVDIKKFLLVNRGGRY